MTREPNPGKIARRIACRGLARIARQEGKIREALYWEREYNKNV